MPILNDNGGLGILNGICVIWCLDYGIVGSHSFQIKYDFYGFWVGLNSPLVQGEKGIKRRKTPIPATVHKPDQ